MIFDSVPKMITVLAEREVVMCLDIGRKTIGVAVGDARHILASPLLTVKRTKFTKDLLALQDVIEDRKVGGVVIGLPLNHDGSENVKCQSHRQFARNMLKEIDIAIAFYDESFSTDAVMETLVESCVPHKRRAELVDKLAAAHILQSAFDVFNRHS